MSGQPLGPEWFLAMTNDEAHGLYLAARHAAAQRANSQEAF